MSAGERWHDDYGKRKSVGDSAEIEFRKAWLCHCGGRFRKYAPSPGLPDFVCEGCGQMVDVKSGSPKYPSISQVPFDGYGSNVVLARRFSAGDWRGARKRDLDHHKRGPIPPSHKDRGTFFYRFPPELFKPLSQFLRPNYGQFGLGVSAEEQP